MATFKKYDTNNAPAAAQPQLEGVEQAMGFVPNLFKYMAEAPNTIEAYTKIDEIYSKSTLSPAHRQVVLLATSVYNDCRFCVAAHTGAAQGTELSKETLDALRNGQTPADEQDAALAHFATQLVDKRGFVTEADVDAFLAAGFTPANVFEVILGVTLKTLSNYVNHVCHTELNDELQELAWPGK